MDQRAEKRYKSKVYGIRCTNTLLIRLWNIFGQTGQKCFATSRVILLFRYNVFLSALILIVEGCLSVTQNML